MVCGTQQNLAPSLQPRPHPLSGQDPMIFLHNTAACTLYDGHSAGLRGGGLRFFCGGGARFFFGGGGAFFFLGLGGGGDASGGGGGGLGGAYRG